MNELKIFENSEFGEVRAVTIDEEPYFVGKDVAEILGYTNPSEALIEHVDTEDKLNSKTLSSFELDLGQRGGWLINESGLYSLILSSKLPSAKKFKRWVTSEVLPAIRKHGVYMTNEVIEKTLLSPDYLIQIATALKEERQARVLAENKIAEQKPLVDFAQHVTESSDTVDVGEFSKIVTKEHINIGRNKLFAWFRENGYLMNNNVPYQKYVDGGYFKVIEVQKNTAYGVNLYTKTLITGKGQVYFVEKLRTEFSAEAA